MTDQAIAEISATQYLERAKQESLTLLDVREDWELGVASVQDQVSGFIHIPMGQVSARLSELDRGKEVVVLCRSGRRSLEIAKLLQANGFRTANLSGGILAWSREVDSRIPQY